MALDYELNIMSESNWDGEEYHTFNMYFSEPEEERQTPPGILLLIAGYAGEARSKIYRKMRAKFADEYNLYVVQCNYLGWEFMQENEEIRAAFLEFSFLHKNYRINKLAIHSDLQETRENYNEMGPLQAMDNIIAVKSLIDVLNTNHKTFDRSRVACFGQSHGAFLGHLCNVLFPDLFSDMIDNSSYLFPVFMNKNRYTFTDAWSEDWKIEVTLYYNYIIDKKVEDMEIYDLLKLYNQFENSTKIEAFHGSRDIMTTCEEKKKLKDIVPNLNLNIIQESDVDGEIFKSAEHGLDTDFIKLIQYVLTSTDVLQGKRKKGGSFQGNLIKTKLYQYESILIDGVPRLIRRKR